MPSGGFSMSKDLPLGFSTGLSLFLPIHIRSNLHVNRKQIHSS